MAAANAAQVVSDNAERDLRRQQELEFEQALVADRQMQQQQEEEQEQRRLEQDIRAAEEASQQEEQARRHRLQNVELPAEPLPGPNVAKILFKLPTGNRVTRRFLGSDKLKLLQSFVHTQGIVDDFSLVLSFPARQLDDHLEETVESAGLMPSAQVLVTLTNDQSEDEE